MVDTEAFSHRHGHFSHSAHFFGGRAGPTEAMSKAGDIAKTMTSLHPDLKLVAGDSWVIPGALTDVGGQPLDLTDAGLEWVLIDDDAATGVMLMGFKKVIISASEFREGEPTNVSCGI